MRNCWMRKHWTPVINKCVLTDIHQTKSLFRTKNNHGHASTTFIGLQRTVASLVQSRPMELQAAAIKLQRPAFALPAKSMVSLAIEQSGNEELIRLVIYKDTITCQWLSRGNMSSSMRDHMKQWFILPSKTASCRWALQDHAKKSFILALKKTPAPCHWSSVEHCRMSIC